MKAQAADDATRAAELLNGLVLPNPRQWYFQVFDRLAATNADASYEANVATLPAQLAQFFASMNSRKVKHIEAVRFDATCDDSASENTFGVLESRIQAVPLYELRFLNGDRFASLFALAYVEGGFRFIIPPDIEKTPPYFPEDAGSTKSASATAESTRITRGGNEQAKLLTYKVVPQYPLAARREFVQGTVRIRAIVGGDGSIKAIRVVKGACSLAQAAAAAVKQWRYKPATIQGRPIEVDTTIDVTFSLQY